MRAVIITAAALVFASGLYDTQAAADPTPSSRNSPTTLVVSGPQHVQDTTLRSGQYWGKWNFGNSQFLQVGFQPSTVYDTYHTVSLVRFDLAGLPYLNVKSARLRLYFPRNLIQQAPVPVHVYQVSASNADWMEGNSEAQEQADACTWDSRSQNQPWAGGPGLSEPVVDYAAQPLDTKTVTGLAGEWVEFDLPAQLVQSWMNDPNKNAGLLIKTDEGAELGQSTYICSSEHWSGKGPQLVLVGSASQRRVGASRFTKANYNSPFQLPPMGPVYHRWLQESSSRYAIWAQDKSINLAGTQALFPYLWDIVFRADIILPKAILPLSRETEEVPAVVSRGDRVRARQIMDDFMKYMMVFDYERDQNWYDSGPTADVLSPLQIAQFFVKTEQGGGDNDVKGIYSQYDDGRWSDNAAASDETEAAIEAQLATIKERLKPTPEQYAKIEAVLRENMPLEKSNARELKKGLDRVRQLIQARDDGPEMLQALRTMFFHHRLFLIHQSLFSMPKYSVLMETGDILEYARWFYEVRHGQYSHERVGRQLAAATRYLWKPSQHREAEYTQFEGCKWSDAIPGFSGTGYVLFGEAGGGQIDWQTDIAAGGTYRLVFRYTLAAAEGKSLRLTVNGKPLNSSLLLSPTSSNTWSTLSVAVNLPPGQNNISLACAENDGPALDYLDIEPIRGSPSQQASAHELRPGNETSADPRPNAP